MGSSVTPTESQPLSSKDVNFLWNSCWCQGYLCFQRRVIHKLHKKAIGFRQKQGCLRHCEQATRSKILSVFLCIAQNQSRSFALALSAQRIWPLKVQHYHWNSASPHHFYRTGQVTTYYYSVRQVLAWASKLVISQIDTSTWRNSCWETDETT